jgi:predicted O-methyltransferase YrrM
VVQVRVATRGEDFGRTLAEIRSVDGWLTDDQAGRLWTAARRASTSGLIVEIGSYRGRSTIVLARAAGPDVEVVAIDPHAGNDRGPRQWEGAPEDGHEDHRRFHENLERAGVASAVRHVRKFSDDALPCVDGEIDVLYIDGAHRYRPALADLRLWGDRIRADGTMLVHDSFASIGVTLALLRHCVVGGSFAYIGREGSLAEYRRTSLRGATRAHNAIRQLTELGWFARNIAVKLVIVARAWPLLRLLGHRGRHWPY